ncbi:hypothetical protein C8R45DRAFT_1025857 [Mycena sanguinolenta]|nr:hypothetical protein C8R45DRAFT_1025857 [Mycena sanguinolenta]
MTPHRRRSPSIGNEVADCVLRVVFPANESHKLVVDIDYVAQEATAACIDLCGVDLDNGDILRVPVGAEAERGREYSASEDTGLRGPVRSEFVVEGREILRLRPSLSCPERTSACEYSARRPRVLVVPESPCACRHRGLGLLNQSEVLLQRRIAEEDVVPFVSVIGLAPDEGVVFAIVVVGWEENMPGSSEKEHFSVAAFIEEEPAGALGPRAKAWTSYDSEPGFALIQSMSSSLSGRVVNPDSLCATHDVGADPVYLVCTLQA